MAQDVIYPGEGSMCTWEKGEIRCFGSNWSIVSFKVCVSLLIFCLVDLSIGVSGVLKSPTINDNPVCETAKETQMYKTVSWTLWERWGRGGDDLGEWH